MDFDKLCDMANEYINFSCKPKNRKYKVGEIIDEDKTVRWNREEVERRNKSHEEEVKELNRKKNEMLFRWVDAVKLYIIEETKVKKDKADEIYNYLYEKYHSYGLLEVLANMDELLDLFK